MAGPESSIDVGLPTDLPITDFLDELVLRLAGPPEVADPALEWTLSPLGRDALAPDATLRGADVQDGTWLVLREGPAADPAVLVDDTLDALTELTDSRHRSWSPRAARIAGASVATAAAVVAALGLMLARTGSSPTVGLLTAALAAIGAIGLLAAALYASRNTVDDRNAAIAACLCPMAAALSAAAGFAVVPGDPGLPHVVLAVAAACTSGVITLRYGRTAPMLHIAGITAGLVALVAALAALAAPVTQVGAGVCVLALLLVLAAPRLTVALAKIPLPPVPSPGEPIEPVEAPLLPTIDAVDAISLSTLPDLDALAQRAERARQCLTGLCLGSAVAGAVAATTVGIDSPDWRFTTIALDVGLALILRGRSHTDLVQAAALIGGGAAAILGFWGAAAIASALRGTPTTVLTAALAATLVAAVALILGGWAAGRTFTPVQRRAAELGEYVLLAILLPLLLWVLEVYRLVREAW
ncbi:MAG: type VII secretion integral membrane protein EccD [Gordonia sp. (in: high G+C Gram-positive bacteria)]|uniref:type VII secretion integral membrane protein EccD n=1 Tax=Gordonia sp. (in: high G+C Gram-positive bacteria) TaxID=84139 RepID=UPI0039E44A8C